MIQCFRPLRLTALMLAMVFAVPLAGCGKKGSPKPPEDTAPAPVKNISARGAVDAVEIQWDAPETTLEGDSLNQQLGGFTIRRSEFVKGETPDFNDIGSVKPNENSLSLTYSFRDTGVVPGSVYEYVIVPADLDGVEGLSDQVLRVTFLGEATTVENIATPLKVREKIDVDLE